MDTTFIYALNDPETGECRYVGKADDPKKRLICHLSEGRGTKKPCHRTNWIKSLLARGLYPVLEVLDEVLNIKSVWTLWERAWIKASREIGMDLTNATDGGEDPPSFKGKTRSPETCAKMSLAQKGKKLSLEHCAKLSAALKGKPRSPESCAKQSVARLGKKHSPEHCAKLSTAQKGKKHSPETCAKMRAAQKRRQATRQLNFPNE